MKMNTRWWQRKLAGNVRIWELGVFLLVYFIFGSLYSLALYLTSSNVFLPRTVIDYVLKFTCTIPIWWLLFVRLRQWPDAYRIALHIVLCPLFIISWLSLYHYVIDTFNIGRLDGKGMWWDVYIPFMFYVVQFGILHGYDLWKKTRMQQERENELLHLAHQSEMSALKAQLQPHFLFNTLNSINAGLTSANEDVRERIARLADTVRYSLRASQQETVPLYEELQFVKDYLWLEQERFKDRLHIIYHIDEDLAKMEVPPMLLQPLVENAVKHGIAPSIEGGIITITVHRQHQKIGFEIADTGAGMNGTSPEMAFTKGIGLKNTRHRLAYLYDEAIHIESNHPIGTKVYFSIPDISKHP